MRIDPRLCVGCANCVAVCPVGAISVDPASRRARVDRDACVECFTCHRMSRERLNPTLVRALRRALGFLRLRFDPEPDVCPTSAIVPEELEWPRTVRRAFSDVRATHESTGILGRGTEEVKTNDVTERLPEGRIGFVVELGRPSVGTRFTEIQTVAEALAAAGVEFEEQNPVTGLMTDPSSGSLDPEVLGERVLSAILEFRVEPEEADPVLDALEEVAGRIDTVMSIGLAARCDSRGANVVEPLLARRGLPVLRAKTNLGLGRPDPIPAGPPAP